MGIRTLLYLFRLGLKKSVASQSVYSGVCHYHVGLYFSVRPVLSGGSQCGQHGKKTEQEVYVAVFFDEGILPERVEEIGNPDSEPSGSAADRVCVRQTRPGAGLREILRECGGIGRNIRKRIMPLASSGNYRYILTG